MTRETDRKKFVRRAKIAFVSAFLRADCTTLRRTAWRPPFELALVSVLAASLFSPLLAGCRLFDKQTATVILQQGEKGYAGCSDATLLELPGEEDNNTGGNSEIEAGRKNADTPNDDSYAVIRFDLGSIPRTADVRQASLSLYYMDERNGIGALKTLEAHRLTAAWEEGAGTGAGGQNVPGVDWLWLGANPYDPEVLDRRTLGAVDFRWYSFDITETVRDWVANPDANHGILLKPDIPDAQPTNPQGVKAFASRNHPTVSRRPSLTVTCVEE